MAGRVEVAGREEVTGRDEVSGCLELAERLAVGGVDLID